MLWVRLLREQQLCQDARAFELACAAKSTEDGRRDYCNRLQAELDILRSGNPHVAADTWQPPQDRLARLVTALKIKVIPEP